MDSAGKKLEERVPWKRRGARSRLECRECEVICERVISPWQCLRSRCPSVYAYEDEETTYFGCLWKVFAPELDLGSFREDSAHLRRGPDPYGPLRINRAPRPQCRVTVEQAYESSFSGSTCCNPTFFHHPAGPPDDAMRLTIKAGDEADPGPAD